MFTWASYRAYEWSHWDSSRDIQHFGQCWWNKMFLLPVSKFIASQFDLYERTWSKKRNSSCSVEAYCGLRDEVLSIKLFQTVCKILNCAVQWIFMEINDEMATHVWIQSRASFVRSLNFFLLLFKAACKRRKFNVLDQCTNGAWHYDSKTICQG